MASVQLLEKPGVILNRLIRFIVLIITFIVLLCVVLSDIFMQHNKTRESFRIGLFNINRLSNNSAFSNSMPSSKNRSDLPKIIIVLGTRPEAVKCAPLITELKSNKYRSRLQLIVLSTGQHRQILNQTLSTFEQRPDVDLNLMMHNQKLSDLFHRVFSGVNHKINTIRPKLLIVQGDTTTALASSLAAAYNHIPVAHVEAGLRSFNISNPYPEELNRRIIDSFATLMFAPTTFAKEVLLREGACETDVFVTGNTGIDAFYEYQRRINATKTTSTFNMIDSFRKNFANKNNSTVILVTMHRRENFEYLSDMCRAIATIAKKHEQNVLIILPVHPNPNVRNVVFKILDGLPNVQVVDPISYEIFGYVLSQSDIILTDSGGIQEEASSIGKTVLLLRTTTERPEGIYLGTIKQVGIVYDEIVQAVNHALNDLNVKHPIERKMNIFGDGTASKKIAAIIDNYLNGEHISNLKCSTKYRQDSIAKTVYSSSNTSYQAIMPHSVRRRIMNDLTKVRAALTLNELLRLPSRYNNSMVHTEAFRVTAIVGVYRREGLIRRWIEALLSQTHPPTEIWFVHFASPIAQKLNEEIDQIRALFSNGSHHCHEWCTKTVCKMNTMTNVNDTSSICSDKCIVFCKQMPSILLVGMGEMQLKYFGRFQFALQCKTKYVVVFDDDCIPQPRYFETALHTINTEQYRGILGTKGTPAAGDFFYGPVSRSDRIVEVDVVGGSWFMESEWVKLMFHDKMHSWNTGEDFHLCANARKYANLRSFVMPVDKVDASTHSFTTDYLSISDKGDTTNRVAGTGESRTHIKDQQWLRGDRLMNSYQNSKPSLLIYAETHDDAMLLISNTKEQMLKMGGLINFATSNIIGSGLQVNEIKRNVRSFHDFMIGRDYNTNLTSIAAAAEVLYAFDMVIQGTQSTAVIIVGSSSTETMFALATASFLRHIPIINIYFEDKTVNRRIEDAISALSLTTIRIRHEATTRTSEFSTLNNVLADIFK